MTRVPPPKQPPRAGKPIRASTSPVRASEHKTTETTHKADLPDPKAPKGLTIKQPPRPPQVPRRIWRPRHKLAEPVPDYDEEAPPPTPPELRRLGVSQIAESSGQDAQLSDGEEDAQLPQEELGKAKGEAQAKNDGGLGKAKREENAKVSDIQAAAAQTQAEQQVATYTKVKQVSAVDTKLTGALAKVELPPDAFALLRDAREEGYYCRLPKENHREEDEDPALRAAVEECIRQCFGVAGILRIGPGHNENDEAIIVVEATRGFSHGGLAKVPITVHGFQAVVAVPFDLLPLKRDLVAT